MANSPPLASVDSETAALAESALTSALASLLEAAIETVAQPVAWSDAAHERTALLNALISDANTLAAALGVILRRAGMP